MKKKKLFLIIALFAIVCAAVITAACTPKKLGTPQNLKIEDLDLTWDSVEGATGYLVGVNYEEYEVKENRFDLINLPELGKYNLEVQALGDGKKYLDSYWSEKIQFNLKATEGLKYTRSAASDLYGTYQVTARNLDISGVLVVPSTYNGFSVTSISVGWCENITAVYIPESVLSISISQCDSLKVIRISNAVIGLAAFTNCPSLERIEVEEGNKVYKSENNCIIHKADNALVAGCKNSKIPEYIETISKNAFYKHSGLTKIEIPERVKTIGDSAFFHTGLKEMKIYDSVETIGSHAFANTGITKLRIPANLSYVGDWAFAGCTFEEITVAEANTAFKMDNHCLISLADNTALCAENVEELIIPDYVTRIDYSLSPNENSVLKKLIIPESVTRIDGSFAKCEKLESVVLPYYVKKMWENVFRNCTIYSVQEKMDNWSTVLGGIYDSNSCVTVFSCTVKYDGIYPYVYSVERGNIRNSAGKGANPPERDGYTFGGWTTEEGGTTAEYSAEQIELVPQGTTVYAIWVKQ